MKSGLRRAIRNQAPPVPLAPYGYRRGSMFNLGAGTANKETYLRAYGRSGTVFAIVSLLQQAAASPAWHLYKKQQDGRVRYTTSDQGTDQRVEIVKHAALSLWNKPNDFHSGFEFREGANQHQELTGETFWVLSREGTTFPTSMWYVRPDRMDPVPSPDDYLVGWIYTGPNGEQVPLQLDEVIMEKLPDPLDCFRGAGPVASILPNIEQQRYATEYQRNLFLNGATPGGIIQVDKRLNDGEWDELVDRWRESHQGIARAGRVGVLENGATWLNDAPTNKDMEYANLRLANRDELREAWRMHKTMLGTADDVNRANAQTAQEVFVGWQTIPRLDRRKDTLNCKLLPLFGAQNAEFDYEDPSPDNREEDNGEMTAKTTAFAALIDAGVDPDDAAEVVGLPSMAMVEKATQAPALPPGWVPEVPAAPPSGSPGQDDDVTNLLRRVYDAGKHGGGPRKQGKKKKKKPKKPAETPATVPGKQWVADENACAQCQANAADGAIPTGALFDGGVVAPPQHPNCLCGLDDVAVPAAAARASGDELAALFRRVLSDGYVPVETTRRH